MQSPAYPQPPSPLAAMAPGFLARLFAAEVPEPHRLPEQMPAARDDSEPDLAARVRLTGEW